MKVKKKYRVPFKVLSNLTGRSRTVTPRAPRRIPSLEVRASRPPISVPVEDYLDIRMEPSQDYDNPWEDVEVSVVEPQTSYHSRQQNLDNFWDSLRPALLDYILNKDDPLPLCECQVQSRKVETVQVVCYRGMYVSNPNTRRNRRAFV
jgi:hypothetical protein